ncbi:MAG: histidinol dehydrogenase [candidate division KSB1 bacterium]|jgi:histidinol dehydrogenase|nr:histidinol dehydrogenase [candidate division KSB1 bacterium]
MKIIRSSELTENFFRYQEIEEIGSVGEIVADVQQHGDSAVKRYTERFDNVSLDIIEVDRTEMRAAGSALPKEDIAALKRTAASIRTFAEKQKEARVDFEYEIEPGVITGQKIVPIERAGIYTPGGRFPLPSTVLMCAIPAKVAGVQEVLLCSPPTHGGSIHPAILAAADLCEVDKVYRIGGVQAVAAMAYGTESVMPVDIIVGPGNKYVTAAKKLVYGTVGIDFIAGPTEVLIIADEWAREDFVAADLLAQAEHDTNAVPILVTDSYELANRVNAEIEKQLSRLNTAEIARISMENNGLIILVNHLDEAVEIANRKAPEHLEVQLNDPNLYLDALKNYGSLFIGVYSAEVLGDYSSGLNHTLPTNTTARYTGGLSVNNFLKTQTTLRITKKGLHAIGPTAERLGHMEGLSGHANSTRVRLDSE